MGSSLADMFNVSDPEKAGKLALTLLVLGIGISIIMFAISVLCLAKEAICCLKSIVSCFKGCCDCCVSRICGGKSGEEGDEDGGRASAAGSAARGNVGQLMSLVVMIFSILTALIWEFYFAEGMDSQPGTRDPWSVGCEPSMAVYPMCLRYQAAYRVAFVCFVFFAAMAVVTRVQPAWHNEGWDVKLLCYAALLIGLTFAPNPVFDNHGFVWVARIGAFLFLILQQIILIDSAYCVNEYLVERGYADASRPGTEDTWNKWLVACLALSLGLFAAAVTGLVLLMVWFTGCDNSNTFIALTTIMVAAFTAIQLFFTQPGENAGKDDGAQGHNFLASSVVAAYVVYLCFVAVSANPTEECNVTYSKKENMAALVMGLLITFLSITSTVYFASKSATNLLSGGGGSSPATTADLESVLTGQPAAGAEVAARPSLTRQVTGGGVGGDDGAGGQSWKFNFVMALISCYWCCVLTDWGNPGGGATGASPTAGNTAMWMNITASWICGLLYTWTLLAPRLFPGRDFSR